MFFEVLALTFDWVDNRLLIILLQPVVNEGRRLFVNNRGCRRRRWRGWWIVVDHDGVNMMRAYLWLLPSVYHLPELNTNYLLPMDDDIIREV